MDEKLTPSEESRASAALSLAKDQAPKKDAAAARELPALYHDLGKAREAIEKFKAAGGEHVNVHQVSFNLAGDELVHSPRDKKAAAEWLLRDLEAHAAEVAGKIKALGFSAD